MKKIIVVLVILLLAVGGFFGYKQYLKNKSNKENTATKETFQWGATMRASATGLYTLANWQKEIKLAKDMGLKWARVSWLQGESVARNDEILQPLFDAKMNAFMIIEQDPDNHKKNYYQQGYKDGFSVADHYKNKIRFFQLGNETGSGSIKSPTSNGQKESDFDQVKYEQIRDYDKGLSEGIAKANPGAWRVISISYTHTGVIDKMVADKVEFDAIGINWYDWMGPIAEKRMDDGTLYVDKLRSYGKPIIFTEVNTVPQAEPGKLGKTKVDEDKQATFLTDMAKWCWANRDLVAGMYIHELVDSTNNPNPDNMEYFGIVKATRPNGSTPGTPTEPRKAYYAMQSLLKNLPK